jgi:hypothetical protein
MANQAPQPIKSIAELVDAVDGFRADKRWRYRGHADASWKLVPKAGRDDFKRVDDELIFRTWKKMAVGYHTGPIADDWDWLAIAQHHGLATRLLDWTISPLTAAFFAACECEDKDGVIYAAHFNRHMPIEKATPYVTKFTGCVKPRGVVPRIVRQGGSFTYHAEPAKPLLPDGRMTTEIREFTIPKMAKKEIISQLSFLGTSRYSLFPDLDGLSSFVNWSIASGEYWRL